MSTFVALAVIVVLTIANGLFAMSETAVVSARRARLQDRAARGDASAARALALSDNPNVFLSTVQIGITLIGIVLGAFGGSRFSGPVSDLLAKVPFLEPIADSLAFALVVLIITYVSLVIGELVPKRIALNRPETIATLIAGPMTALSRIVSPFVWLLGASTNAVLSLLRIKESTDPPVTEEEVGMLLQQGTLAGVFHPEERKITERVFDLADDRVSSHMTPRPEVVWIERDATSPEIRRTIESHPHSRYPVGDGTLDNLVGIVSVRELLLLGKDGELALPSEFEPSLVLPESTMAFRALERFRHSGQTLAMVVDEYGGIAGVLSITDLLEALVGDIAEPGEIILEQIQKRADGSWLIDGGFPADKLEELLGISHLPGEAEGLFETTAGFVLAQLGHIPVPGEHFVVESWKFEVVDMDGRRVDKVLAVRDNEEEQRHSIGRAEEFD